jgi:hypothetical protein
LADGDFSAAAEKCSGMCGKLPRQCAAICGEFNVSKRQNSC